MIRVSARLHVINFQHVKKCLFKVEIYRRHFLLYAVSILFPVFFFRVGWIQTRQQ